MLYAGAHAIIQAHLKDGEDHPWESRAEFVADAQGIVDTSKQAPVSGSYKDPSAMGLVWSMTPTKKGVERYHPPQVQPQEIDFDVIVGGKQVTRQGATRTRLATFARRLLTMTFMALCSRLSRLAAIRAFFLSEDLKAAFPQIRPRGWPRTVMLLWHWPIFDMQTCRRN